MPLNVGIVGFGYAAATFHAPLIAATPGLDLVAVASRDSAKVHAVWPRLDVCDTPEALIARPDIDLIVLATPNETHYPLAAKALEAGRHVVVDKPFTLDVAEARALIDQARTAERLLSVFHNRRWDADFLTVKQVLISGELGRLTLSFIRTDITEVSQIVESGIINDAEYVGWGLNSLDAFRLEGEYPFKPVRYRSGLAAVRLERVVQRLLWRSNLCAAAFSTIEVAVRSRADLSCCRITGSGRLSRQC